MQLELHGRTENGKLMLSHYQREQRNRFLIDMKQSNVTVKYAKERKPKSQQQLGYIFAGIINFVKAELDDRGFDVGETGAPWTKEQIRAVLYHQYQTKHDCKKTLSKMDMTEASAFIDSCLQWLAGNPWRIAVPDPRPKISPPAGA